MALTGEGKRKLAAMILLHQGWRGVAEARMVVLVRAAAMIEMGLLSVPDVCQALQISPSTWFRWARVARPLMLDAAAEVERALRDAGANTQTTLDSIKDDPDMELALSMIGVHHRVPHAKEQ